MLATSRGTALLAALSLAWLPAPSAFADEPGAARQGQFHHYVALGDSYVAGPGVDPVDPASGSCSRSLNNYPSQVADSFGLERDTNFFDVSCSGATSYGLTSDESPQIAIAGHPAMVDSVDANTDLVTLTVGANNDGLAQAIFFECNISGGGCEQRVAARPQLGDLAEFYARLTDSVADAIRHIHQVSPKATVVVVGYLRVGAAWCPAWSPYNAQDSAFIDSVQARMNNALKTAAAQTGAKFVDVNAGAGDHGVCSEDPWVKGGGSLIGNDIALHPLAAGEDAAARAVLSVLGR